MKRTQSFSANTAPGLSRARARFLTQAIQLEEHAPSALISAASILSLALIFAGIAWAAITQVSELAHARGKIVPEGFNHTVQHLDGGLVTTLAVRSGDSVNKGDLLIQFDQSTIRAELEKMNIRKTALELEAERLSALIDDRAPQFTPNNERYPNLASKQLTIYRAQKASHNGELQVTRSQVEQRKQEVIQQQNSVQSLQTEVALLQEQVQIRDQLGKDHAIARTDILAIRSQFAELQSDLRRARDGVSVAISAREEARQRGIQITVSFYKELELKAGATATDLAEVLQSIVVLRARLRRTELHASIDGVVQGLTITSAHAVLKPGQVIMEIVPVDNLMLVEAHVSPSDVGHVRIGQAVEIKVDSYDPSKFGIVEGKIERISANTYLDEQQQPYYRSEISLAKAYLGRHVGELRLIPGMTVTADITTGSKTLLDYLLKPINRGLQTAFTER